MARNSWQFLVGGCRSWKANALLNLTGHHQPDIDKICLYAKDSYEAKYQLLINKGEGASIKHFNDSEPFIEFFNDTDNICKIIEEYNPNKKQKILIVWT